MMQSLRDNMKLVIWITAIAFLVGFGILQLGGVLDNGPARGPQGVIATINGEPIRYDAFMQTYNQMMQQLTQSRPLQEGEDSYVREQAWQQTLRSTLIRQEAKRLGYQVTPEEIKTAIRLTPPDFITRAPVFQTDGQFDYRKYLAELDNPNSQLPWTEVEAYVASALPAQLLQDAVVAAAKVSDADVRERYMLMNDKMQLRFVNFPADSFPVDTSKIGGADVESYYKAHPDQFRGPEQAKVQVLLVPRLPDDSDFAAAHDRLQGVLDMARANPDSFPSYARAYSEIGSAGAGGDPGGEPYVDEMRPAFRAGLRNVQPGQVSDILREEKSLHIFRVDKRFPDPSTGRERIHYHEIAVRVNPGAEAIHKERTQAIDAVKEAKKDGVAAVATRLGFRTFQSDYFARGQSRNSVFDAFPEVEAWIFEAKVGSISSPIPTESGWYVYQILDRRAAGLRPLAEVKDEARLALIASLETAKAEAAATQARAAVLGGMSDADAAKKFRGVAGAAGGVTRNGYVNGIGREPRAVGMLFTMTPQSWSPVLTGNSGAFIAYIDSHTPPSEADFQNQAPKLRQSLLNERRQVVFTEWMQELRGKAKIVDYRENYFEA
jgi:parvulin-like peptidyl-prolyl isomerase